MGYTGQRPSAIPLTTADIVDGTISNADLAGSITSAKITSLDSTKLTGTIHVDRLTNAPATDLSKLEYNQAILAFKVASANQLAKFSMVDQVIDEYQDATGIDAGASTTELLSGTGITKYYEGGTSSTPTITENSDSNGTDGLYTWYKWTSGSSGSFASSVAQNAEVLVVAGGGGGGHGGGGAGGYRTSTAYALSANTAVTSITVGTGGAKGGSGAVGANGTNSIFGTITSTGGGGGGSYTGVKTGGNGGSGGGWGGNHPTSRSISSPVTDPIQGYGGGSSRSDGVTFTVGGGGGGAGGAGGDIPVQSPDNGTAIICGQGGIGLANDITGSSLFYAGGGGGGGDTAAAGGTGGSGVGGNGTSNAGGAAGTATTPTANRGGGGGGNSATAKRSAGAAGVVVVRVLTTALTTGADVILQSVATTAESAPTTADLVMLIEDSGSGTATINTDIKAKVSRDGSAFSGYVTLVDEGNWGTDKRILVARNIDISGIASGVAMKYKIETFNQSAGSKETRIHATSLAWA
jgi:hypothetical protein